MSLPELRPMGIGDILDATFRLYRQRFLTFLLIALVVYVPYGLLQALFTAGLTPTSPGAGPQAVETFGLIGFLVGIIGTLIFAIIFLPLCGAAMIHNISASYLGDELTAGDSYRRAAPRLLSLLGTQILAGVIIVIGYLLLIVPGVIFSLWFFVVMPVVVLERLGGSEALGRSRELMRGNLGKAFTLAVVLAIMGMIVNGIIGQVVRVVPGLHPALTIFFQSVLLALWLPIQTAPPILLYYDLRIRKEAFDLERLAEALGQPATT